MAAMIPAPRSRILTINGGSSSFKFSVFEVGDPLLRLLKGAINGIGQPEGSFTVHGSTGSDDLSRSMALPDRAGAVRVLMAWLSEHIPPEALAAVGHRVVHGGAKYWEPQRLTPSIIEDLRGLTPFDPEHLPAELLLIEELSRHFPQTPQVACFDTVFHHDMPRVARLLPIPRRYETQGVRRYGFHGLSYSFLMQELARLGETAANGRVVLAHLGSGAIALFCQQAKKWLGAYAAVLRGLDPVVFAGGIGENAPQTRTRICDGLGFLGIELDDSRNAESAGVISADRSRVSVRVIRTNEELMIARLVSRALGLRASPKESEP